MPFYSPRLLAVTTAIALMAGAGAAHAGVVISSFTGSTFTVDGPGNNAFCSSGTACDFRGGGGGNATNTVNAPLLAPTSSAGGLPQIQPGSPAIVGQSGNVLQWWTPGTYGNVGNQTSVTGPLNAGVTPSFNIASGTQQLFSDTSFFPPGGSGPNDTGTFLTALFTGTADITGGSTLTFTGSVDDNVIAYYRTSGTSDPYTLLALTPTNLSNQPTFNFTSASLGTGLYDFEIFYADRSSTDAAFTLNAVVTAAVPEPSTWAMLILGFAGLGVLGYRRQRGPSFRVV